MRHYFFSYSSPLPESPATTSQYSGSGRRRRRDGRRRKSSQSCASGGGEPRKPRDCCGGRGSPSPSPTPTTSPLPPSPLSPSTSPEEHTVTSPLQAGFNKDTASDKTSTGSKPVPETGFSTPKSTPETTPKSGFSAAVSDEKRQSRHQNKTRKKLSDSYGTREGKEVKGKEGEGEKGRGKPLTNGLPSPVGLGPSKKVWGGGESKPVSLKDIMAEEEKRETARAPPPSSPPYTIPPSQSSHPPTSRQTSLDTPPHPHNTPPHSTTSRQASSEANYPSASPRSVPASRQTSCDTHPSSSLPRSPPTNPWRTAQPPSPAPVVSLKELMAEETLRAQEMRKTRSHPPLSTSSSHPTPHSPAPPSQRYIQSSVIANMKFQHFTHFLNTVQLH